MAGGTDRGSAVNQGNYWLRRNATVSRRRFLAGTGLVGGGIAAALTVGCGSGEDDSSSSQNTTGTSSAASPATTQVAKRGGTLTMARAGNLAFADPQRSSGGNDPVFTRLYAETLLRYDGDTIKAYIAESLEQPDTSTVTLKLRKDIKFADGTPVNAEAVKFAVERGKDAKLNAPVRPAMSLIKTVETPDEFTAVLKLERPNALFLSSFAPSSYLVSPTALTKMGQDEFTKKPVSAGPYKVEKITQDGESVFVKDPEWPIRAANGDQLPYIDRIINRVIPQPEALVAALLAGDVQLVNVVDLASVSQLKSSDSAGVFEVPAASWQTVEFVTNRAPSDNVSLRKAINYAINREEINKQLAFGLGKPATECLTLDSWLLDSSIQRYEYDAKKATEALGQAGYPDGVDLKIATYAPAQAEAIQQQLAKLKIRLTIDNLELAVYQDKFRTKGEYPLATAGGPTESGELYQYFLTRMGSKGKYNPGQPTNPEWDALITKVETAFEQNERKALYQQMLKKSYEESYRAWTITIPVYYGVSKKLRGVVPLRENRTNPDLRAAWLA